MILNKIKILLSQKFAKDSLITLVSQAILSFCGLVINIIVGNYYGASGLGVFSQSMSYFMLVSIVVNIGIPNSLVKYSAEFFDNPVKLKEILSSSITLNTLISSFSLLLILPFLYFYGAHFYNPELNLALFSCMFAIPFNAMNKNYIGFLNGTRRMTQYSIYQSLRWLVLLSIILLFIAFKQPVHVVIYSLLISESILFIILSIILKEYIKLSFKNDFYKKHLIFGSKTVIAFVVDEVSKSASIIMIGIFLGNSEAGIYSFASTIALGVLMIPGVVHTNFNPIISNLTANHLYDQLQIYMNKIRGIIFKIMIPVNILVLLIFPLIVIIFMKGKEYDSSYLPYYIMMIGVSAISFFTWGGGMLSMAGLLKENLIRVSISMSVNIILNAILIPIFKVEGAAIALSLNFLFQLFLLEYYLRKKIGLTIFRDHL
jgi:O-antigen/teichoic acid export membrane protein